MTRTKTRGWKCASLSPTAHKSVIPSFSLLGLRVRIRPSERTHVTYKRRPTWNLGQSANVRRRRVEAAYKYRLQHSHNTLQTML